MNFIDGLVEYVKSLVTNYAASLLIISSIGLILFYLTANNQKEFPKEAMIAKLGAIVYIIIGISFFIANLFL